MKDKEQIKNPWEEKLHLMEKAFDKTIEDGARWDGTIPRDLLQHSNEEYLKEFVEYLKGKRLFRGSIQEGIDDVLDQFNSLQRETNLKKGGEDETI